MPHDEQQFRIRWAVIPAIILLLIGLLSFGKSAFLTSIHNDWKTIGNDVNRELAEKTDRTIQSYASGLVREAQEIQADPNLRKALLNDARARRALQRELTMREHVDDIAVLVFDAGGRLVSYNRVAPRTSPIDSFEDNSDRWHVVERSTRTFLLYRERVEVGGTYLGDMVISRALSAALPLSNRFFQRGGLAVTLEEEAGSEVVFDFTGSNPLRHDGRYLHVPFVAGSDTLGTAHVQKVIPAVQSERIARYFDAAMAFLFIAFILIASVPVHRWYSRRLSAGWYAGAVTLHVCAVRAAFHTAGITEILFPAEVLDPVHYASSFGWGIVSSPGALLATLLALCIIVLAAAFRLRDWRPRTGRRAFYSTVYILIMLSEPLILRGFAAALRSFVVDSGFNYDDIAPLFDSPMLILMYVNTFLLSVSVSVGVLTSIVLAARILPFIATERGWQAGFTFVMGLVAVAVFGIFTRQYLLEFPVYIAYVILLCIAAVDLAQSGKLRYVPPGRIAVAGFIVVTLAVSSLLSLFMNERRHAEVEAIAENISRPVDTWTQVQAEQALLRLKLLPPEAFSAGRNEYRTAFQLWTETPLSSLQNNSAVVLTDAAGRIVSHFTAGIALKALNEEYLAAVRAQPEGGALDRSDTATVESRAFYAGHIGVTGADGNPLGVIVILEAHDPFAPTDMPFDIIRYEERPHSLAPEDALLYCVFAHGRMTRTSDAGVAKSVPLPAAVRKAVDGGRKSVWGELAFPHGPRTAYFIAPEAARGSGVYAVVLGTPMPLFSAYRALRLGTVFALCLLILLLAGAAVMRKRVLPVSISFHFKLQIALLFVAAIPMVIVWITVRQIIAGNAEKEHAQSIKRNIEALAAALPVADDDTMPLEARLSLLTNRDAYKLRTATGNDVNLYVARRLHATSRPELYETGLLSSSLSPEAYLAVILEERDFAVTKENIGEYTFYVGYSALREAGGELAGILSTPALFAPEITQRAFIYTTASQYVWFAFIIVLVVLASTLLARQIARPLRTLISATQAIAAGDLTRTVETRGSREIEELGASFNTMTAKLSASQQNLAAAERELAWKEMAKQVAHEIRNPLTPMRLAAQHLRHAYKTGGSNIGELIMKITDTILEQVDKLTRISAEFSQFARMPKRTLVTVDLASVIEETLRLFRHSEGVSLQFKPGAGLFEITADREEISSVFTNIVRNAVQAIEGDGEITVTLERTPSGITAEIRDTGSGIPAEVLPRIFEPSFSTKTDGMGLGLAIIKKILDDMEAEIRIESAPGEGATVRIQFPTV